MSEQPSPHEVVIEADRHGIHTYPRTVLVDGVAMFVPDTEGVRVNIDPGGLWTVTLTIVADSVRVVESE